MALRLQALHCFHRHHALRHGAISCPAGRARKPVPRRPPRRQDPGRRPPLCPPGEVRPSRQVRRPRVRDQDPPARSLENLRPDQFAKITETLDACMAYGSAIRRTNAGASAPTAPRGTRRTQSRTANRSDTQRSRRNPTGIALNVYIPSTLNFQVALDGAIMRIEIFRRRRGFGWPKESVPRLSVLQETMKVPCMVSSVTVRAPEQPTK